MEFVSYLLEKENAVIFWNMTGLLIFILFFIYILYRTYKLPKKDAEKYKNSVFEN